jgi:hypothetical protein
MRFHESVEACKTRVIDINHILWELAGIDTWTAADEFHVFGMFHQAQTKPKRIVLYFTEGDFHDQTAGSYYIGYH